MRHSPVTHAVLLAAGAGSRLGALTEHVPKPLLPIDGRPVIDTLLQTLAAAGVTRASIISGHRRDPLIEHLKQRTQPAAISAFVQTEPQGSAHALQSALGQGLDRADAIIAA